MIDLLLFLYRFELAHRCAFVSGAFQQTHLDTKILGFILCPWKLDDIFDQRLRKPPKQLIFYRIKNGQGGPWQ